MGLFRRSLRNSMNRYHKNGNCQEKGMVMRKLIRGLTAFLFVMAVSVAAPAFAAGPAVNSTTKAAPAVQITAPVQTAKLVLRTMQGRQANDPAGTVAAPANGNRNPEVPWVMGTW